MKIAIVYASKTGTTKRAAEALSQALASRGVEAALYNLATQKPDTAAADAVALGGSVRMGRWHRRARAFAKANAQALLHKPLALFACRCGQDDLAAMFVAQIGQALTAHAAFVGCLGGEMNPANQKGLDKLIVEKIVKSEAGKAMAAPGIVLESVAACADALCAEPRK